VGKVNRGRSGWRAREPATHLDNPAEETDERPEHVLREALKQKRRQASKRWQDGIAPLCLPPSKRRAAQPAQLAARTKGSRVCRPGGGMRSA